MFSNSAEYARGLHACATSLTGAAALEGKRVLITGACGMIGSCLTDALMYLRRVKGIDVRLTALGRNEERARARFGEYINDPGYAFISRDVSELLPGNEKYDIIIHAAGNAHPASFVNDPVGTMTGNFIGTERLLSYGIAHGLARFVYISSGEVYGQASPDVMQMTEEYSGYVDPTRVRSCYPCAKRASETLCASYASQYGVETVILRPCHTYGETQTDADSRAVSQFLRLGAAGNDIVLKSAGEQVRSWCHVADCASGILTALLNGKSGNAYNIAHGASVASIAELAETVARASGVRVRFELPEDAEKAGYGVIPRGVLSGDKLLSLGWRPAYSLPAGVAHALAVLQGR